MSNDKNVVITEKQIMDEIKKIEPDFPEEYLTKLLRGITAWQKGKLTYADLEPGGPFSKEEMEPVFEAFDKLRRKAGWLN